MHYFYVTEVSKSNSCYNNEQITHVSAAGYITTLPNKLTSELTTAANQFPEHIMANRSTE